MLCLDRGRRLAVAAVGYTIGVAAMLVSTVGGAVHIGYLAVRPATYGRWAAASWTPTVRSSMFITGDM
jgi:hypothetical protein